MNRFHIFSARPVILVSIILISLLSTGQISPGDLAEPHAHLEGISNCTKCHILGQKVSNEKCLDCHTELKERIDASRGYHASTEIIGKECVLCHSDHHGRKFEMIRFDRSTFDHNLTGYRLEGTHEELSCDDCHKTEFIIDPGARKKKFTYLGLGTDCVDCHDDYHLGTLSLNCLECHNQVKFTPAARFDHQNTDYPLKGQHKDVECVDCHRIEERNGKRFQVFAGIEHGNCNSCHADVHDNKFGQDCRQCHSEESFHIIRKIDEFDHSNTGFPLTGRHKKVDCAACHGTSLTKPLEHDQCYDCHEDYHRGQFRKQGVSPDCSSCHNTDGFSLTSYTIERHNQGVFELRGAHLATPCFACHKKQERWEFSDLGRECIECHNNIHEGYIQEMYYPGGKCTSCHSVDSWGEISFDHSTTSWRLGTAHQDLSCRSCHFKDSSAGVRGQQFKDLNTNCVACHVDEHRGQFAVVGETDCTRCHIQDGWMASGFDHDSARFVLDGKHKDVACNECHYPVTEEGNTFRKYKFEDISCESCHR